MGEQWKAGRVEEAAASVLNWNNPPEIKGRREKERDRFFGDVWTNTGTMTEYTRLTKKLTPVWSSAIRIDVHKELQAAFAKAAPVELDQPNASEEATTLKPDAAPATDTETGQKSPPWLIAIFIIALIVVASAAFSFSKEAAMAIAETVFSTDSKKADELIAAVGRLATKLEDNEEALAELSVVVLSNTSSLGAVGGDITDARTDIRELTGRL